MATALAQPDGASRLTLFLAREEEAGVPPQHPPLALARAVLWPAGRQRLCERSDVFRAMLDGRFVEARQDVLVLR